MHRYRIALAVGLLALAVLTAPALARDLRTELAKTDAAESWATIQRNLTGFARWTLGARPDAARGASTDGQSMGLADFAGSWHRHGIGLTVLPNGLGYAEWRTYRGCDEVAPGAACDDATRPSGFGGGHATVTLSRVIDRTAYGAVSESNDERMMPNGPIMLTELDAGLGFVRFADGPPARNDTDPRDGIALCGPRFVAPAPGVAIRQSPCGA